MTKYMILFKKLDSFLTSEFSNLCHFQIKSQSISFRQKKGFPVSWILYQLHNHNNDYQCWLGHPIGHHSFEYQKLFLNHSSKAMPIVDWNVRRIIIEMVKATTTLTFSVNSNQGISFLIIGHLAVSSWLLKPYIS